MQIKRMEKDLLNFWKKKTFLVSDRDKSQICDFRMLSLWMATAFSEAVLAFNPTPHPQVAWKLTPHIKCMEIFRSARPGRMVFTLERIVFPTMVARFQTALSILTQTIMYPTTTSIHKVRLRSPLHMPYIVPVLSRLQPFLGVWSSLRDLPLWVR